MRYALLTEHVLHFFNYFLWSIFRLVIEPLPPNSCHVFHEIVRDGGRYRCNQEWNVVTGLLGTWISDIGANNHNRRFDQIFWKVHDCPVQTAQFCIDSQHQMFYKDVIWCLVAGFHIPIKIISSTKQLSISKEKLSPGVKFLVQKCVQWWFK